MKLNRVYTYTCLLLALSSQTFAQTAKILKVKTDQSIAKVEPNMWGVFFEDINFGADGGIYAELIKNRSFEFTKPLMGWSIQQNKSNEGEVLVVNRKEVNETNPRYLQIKKEGDNLELANEGFKGMGIKKGLRYDFSMLYRMPVSGIKLVLNLKNSQNKVIGQTTLTPKQTDNSWQKQAISFTATETDLKAKFTIQFEGKGNIDLDMISLFPQDTWKNRPQGLRADMVQMLADMKPGFIRFPGGCIVEGTDLANRYQWKNTIGPIENRKLIMNRWNIEFAHRPAPDYFQSFGLGFFEYFQLAEDIGSDALPILNCGMACQYNSGEVVALNELDPYVQDALDLIEFANGDITTKWGKKRAELGHPKPFNLKMMGIGNENWGPQYLERLAIFTKAIKAKYPDFKLITSSGTAPDGDRFDLLNTSLRKSKADFIDEHYYRSADWFLKNAGHYDNYPRNESKVFVGEYAVHADSKIIGANRNNWQSALAAAALMTGLERNADVVQMASYAPLFAHVDAWQWAPDMIWVDNLKVYGTPDYYVQKLFATNKGTDVVLITANQKNLIGQDGLYASAVVDKATNELIIKIVNTENKAQTIDLDLDGKKKIKSTGFIDELENGNLNQLNSIENPQTVAPKRTTISIKGKKVNLVLKPYSFNVIRIPFSA
ncbi:alpha-L-arabinofuranosidase [Pedobacter sp. LMG 31464]|uniref:non-reducing end alpha-L-arabinofuranosidase n=1 Tax=Pedobacter planticolens TaxID=2679964 RepID=A0A923IW78_9SPHI|nr:alpha-L-arabinofuranosidase C-terminal domain-containing protein [Pedobacter planticolens]MBB2144882.1 alpha-L-arabinofuranosidase [Pedobacter planticolens]